MKTHLARLMRRTARALIAQSCRLDPPKAETVDRAAVRIVAAQERLAKAQRDYGRAVAARMSREVYGDTQRLAERPIRYGGTAAGLLAARIEPGIAGARPDLPNADEHGGDR
ncbi:hypothetical protein JDBV03_01985 [Mycobacterium phage ridax]|nr:hypothetical protein JDBV03_01985 [Mycobacterium phage ridax]